MSYIRTILILSILFAFNFLWAQTNNPIANADAIVIKDNVRFTILTPELIRMEWSENKKFEDYASLVFIGYEWVCFSNSP